MTCAEAVRGRLVGSHVSLIRYELGKTFSTSPFAAVEATERPRLSGTAKAEPAVINVIN
jgi:hypothetical protein